MEWNEIIEMLRELNLVSIFVRVILALLIGGALGIERGSKNRPAGFRTHMLVCLGAALVMMTNQYVFQMYHTSDPVRMGAQVVSGIGFLGAGTILVTGRQQIKGITTAAGLWASACCGLALGIGFYEGAIIGGIVIMVVFSPLNALDGYIREHSKTLELYIEFEGKKPISSFLMYARENQLEIRDMQLNKNKIAKDMGTSLIATVKSQTKRSHSEIMELIERADGIQYIEQL